MMSITEPNSGEESLGASADAAAEDLLRTTERELCWLLNSSGHMILTHVGVEGYM